MQPADVLYCADTGVIFQLPAPVSMSLFISAPSSRLPALKLSERGGLGHVQALAKQIQRRERAVVSALAAVIVAVGAPAGRAESGPGCGACVRGPSITAAAGAGCAAAGAVAVLRSVEEMPALPLPAPPPHTHTHTSTTHNKENKWQ